jgi:DNA-binding transcriptional ArsR family regulator
MRPELKQRVASLSRGERAALRKALAAQTGAGQLSPNVLQQVQALIRAEVAKLAEALRNETAEAILDVLGDGVYAAKVQEAVRRTSREEFAARQETAQGRILNRVLQSLGIDLGLQV